MSLSYSYYTDGLSSRGVKIEDIPVIRLTLKRKDIRKRATGTAVVVNLELDIGEVNVYIPGEPDYIGGEVHVGREIINKLDVLLYGKVKILTVKNNV